uniref:Uncharacterized protein n=1 Tax=Panagrolaimus davidi TaxID=227884 RepID=A0A914QMM3_9BILA
MKTVIILTAILAYSIALPTFGTLQSAGVMGRLLCQGKPYVNAKVKLYDIDTLDVDDLMAEGKSDKNGEFRLVGNETEYTTIDPKLNIYHNCEVFIHAQHTPPDEAIECLRKIEIKIPKDFVAEGPNPGKIFDAGILNLSGKFPGESRDCIN